MYELELFLTFEHMLLWHEQYKTNDNRDYYNCPSEWVARKEGEKCDKEVVDGVIKDSRKEGPECSWFREFKKCTSFATFYL